MPIGRYDFHGSSGLQWQNRVWHRLFALQSLKYLLYGPSQKKYADSYSVLKLLSKKLLIITFWKILYIVFFSF